jgi:hypothetical protein
MKRLNFKTLKGMESRVKYQIKFQDRFAAMDNLDVTVHINRVSESIRQNIKHLPIYKHTCVCVYVWEGFVMSGCLVIMYTLNLFG